MTTYQKILLGLGITSLFLLELLAGWLAYYTFGAVSSSFFLMISGIINLIALLYLIFTWEINTALTVMILVFFALVPYPLYLGHRWILLQEEAGNIVGYAYSEKLENGTYPENLSGYEFTHPELRSHFTYDFGYVAENEFTLDYWIGSRGTSHSYGSKRGKWGYYPD